MAASDPNKIGASPSYPSGQTDRIARNEEIRAKIFREREAMAQTRAGKTPDCAKSQKWGGTR